MNIKRVKKLIIMSCLSMALFIINSTNVFAAVPIELPEYNEQHTEELNKNDFCVYNTSIIGNEEYYFNSGNADIPKSSIYYSNKKIVLAKKALSGGGYTISFANPNVSTGGSSFWLRSGGTWAGMNKQKVYFDLNSYMLGSTGDLSCPTLCFLETNNGSLSILTPDQFSARVQNDEAQTGMKISDDIIKFCTAGQVNIKGVYYMSVQCDSNQLASIINTLSLLRMETQNAYQREIDAAKDAYENSYQEGEQRLIISKNNVGLTYRNAVGGGNYSFDSMSKKIKGIEDCKKYYTGVDYANCVKKYQSNVSLDTQEEAEKAEQEAVEALMSGKGELGKAFKDAGCVDQDTLKSYANQFKEDYDKARKELEELHKEKTEEARENNEITEEEAAEYDETQDALDEVLEEYGEKVAQAFKKYMSQIDNSLLTSSKGDAETCEGLLGYDVMDDIHKYMTWIRIAVPIIIIVLGMVDFGKAVLSDDDKAMNKAVSNLVKRLIIAVFIFFIPLLLSYLLDQANLVADHLTSGCDIRGW